MFTGIIEETGIVEKIYLGKASAVLTIGAEKVLEQTKIGDSISVNGICLTVTGLSLKSFSADVMHETLNRSSLSGLQCGSPVNLERAMPADGRFGGHIVSGHVDGIGKITKICRDDTAVWYTISASPVILKYIVEKGSVAIDGISLTVANVFPEYFLVSVIPHTMEKTILKEKRNGDVVNIETDLLGKYVEKLYCSSAAFHGESKITKEFLTKNGF